MDWSFLITFGIGLVCYLVFLGIFTLVKYKMNKRKLENEIKQNEVENNVNEEANINDKK